MLRPHVLYRHGTGGAQETHVCGHCRGDVLVGGGDAAWRNSLRGPRLGQAADDHVIPRSPALLLLVVSEFSCSTVCFLFALCCFVLVSVHSVCLFAHMVSFSVSV